MQCPKLKILLSEEDCYNNSVHGHGYCRECEYSINWGINKYDNKNHEKLVGIMLVDAIKKVKKTPDKIRNQIEYYKKNRDMDLKPGYRNSVKRMLEWGDDIISANVWLDNKREGVGSFRWACNSLGYNDESIKDKLGEFF